MLRTVFWAGTAAAGAYLVIVGFWQGREWAAPGDQYEAPWLWAIPVAAVAGAVVFLLHLAWRMRRVRPWRRNVRRGRARRAGDPGE